MEMPIALGERTEIGAYADFAGGAPAGVREQLGIAVKQVGGARAVAIGGDTSRFWNRAGGFGGDTPVTADAVAEIVDFYREQGVTASILIAPAELPADWAEIAAKLRLTEGGRFVKLGCEVSRIVDAPAEGLRVGPVDRDRAGEWAAVMMSIFGTNDEGMVAMAASAVGRPNWATYAAFDRDRIVAVGSLFVNGECGDMFGAGTVSDARGRGAQSALLAARAHAAAAEGCKWLVAETGAEQPGQHNTSLHNMLRAGFRPLYERASWVWRVS
jgi:GNAT superfamily N-acetyltransferase